MPAHRTATEPVAGEEKLVRRAQGGNASAFGTLYEAYVDRIYRYVFFRVSDNATAEDITAQTFLKAWDRLDSFQPGRVPFVGWLYRIAHNVIVDHYRGVKPQVPLDDARPSRVSQTRELDDQIELHLETLRLRTALQKLTEDQQQVIILKFILGLDTAEIALHLGKEPGAVRALQMRALQSLARSLQPETE
jgi:RNA polymerase sigma-70 factor (ECF subfamily)